MSLRERQRLREAGIRIMSRDEARAKPEAHWCEALSNTGRCLAYDRRPIVCRLWGAVEGMPCPYGCRPAPRPLTDREGFELLVRALEAGGGLPPGTPPVDVLMARWDENEGQRGALAVFYEVGRASDLLRVERNPELPPEVTKRRR